MQNRPVPAAVTLLGPESGPSPGADRPGADRPGADRPGAEPGGPPPLIGGIDRGGPLAVLGAVLVWSLWSLRATLTPVAYLDDASVHEQMVRFATATLRAGHDPLTAWFPYLGEGSPQFLHYQSLGALLTGAAGIVVGPDTAFRWTLYLLVALWPAALYGAARLFGFGRWVAAAAAVMAPLVASVPAVGYEHGAYVWIGYGLWAQLWASWTLPFAWAASWRALADRRFIPPAALAIAATAAFHFETGYLAFAAPVLFVVLAWRDLFRRLLRAALVLGLAFLAAAWAIVPLIAQGQWASLNQPLAATPLENGYGARTVLSWLVTGRLLDDGHVPVVTVLAAIGLVTALVTWRTAPHGRPVVVAGLASLVLCFGRTTFGAAIHLVPGSSDVFFRRFMMGAQLAAVLLAGLGLVTVVRLAARGGRALAPRLGVGQAEVVVVPAVCAVLAVLLVAVPTSAGYAAVGRYDDRNGAQIAAQHASEAAAARDLHPLLAYLRSHPGGRTYAGLPTNWGVDFTVGAVPVFKYLEAEDIDEVGYTLRTASLMTDPESEFEEDNPSDDVIFGVRYLLLPSSMAAPVPARRTMVRGDYALWTIPDSHELTVERPVGTLREDRADLASASRPYVDSDLADRGEGLTVRYGPAPGVRTAATTTTETRAVRPTSTVLANHAELVAHPDLAAGRANATVHLTRPAVVVLSASYDPGWRVTVDGRPAPTVMMAPAAVGVAVGAGTHTVAFTYVGFGDESLLLVVSGATVVVLVALALRDGWVVRRRRTATRRDGPRSGPAGA